MRHGRSETEQIQIPRWDFSGIFRFLSVVSTSECPAKRNMLILPSADCQVGSPSTRVRSLLSIAYVRENVHLRNTTNRYFHFALYGSGLYGISSLTRDIYQFTFIPDILLVN